MYWLIDKKQTAAGKFQPAVINPTNNKMVRTHENPWFERWGIKQLRSKYYFFLNWKLLFSGYCIRMRYLVSSAIFLSLLRYFTSSISAIQSWSYEGTQNPFFNQVKHFKYKWNVHLNRPRGLDVFISSMWR